MVLSGIVPSECLFICHPSSQRLQDQYILFEMHSPEVPYLKIQLSEHSSSGLRHTSSLMHNFRRSQNRTTEYNSNV